MDFKVFKRQIKATKILTIVGPVTDKVPSHLKMHPQLLVDGGANIKNKSKMCFSIGDGDSFSKKLDLILPKRKDFSDLAFSLNIIPKHITVTHFCGFLGGRRDHEFVNLGEIAHFLKKKKNHQSFLWDDKNLKVMILSKGRFKFSHTGLFTVVAPFSPTKASLKGDCEYQIKQKTNIKTLSSVGLSNLGFGNVKIETTEPIIVFLE